MLYKTMKTNWERFMTTTRLRVLMTLASLPLLLAGQSAGAMVSDSFESIVRAVRDEASRRGVSTQTLDRALAGVQPLAVQTFENNQPERSRQITFAQYYNQRATPAAIEKGRKFMRDHARQLALIEQDTGVPPAIIMAILSIESNFGVVTGDQKVIPALLTLARDVQGNDRRAQERRAMFREEAVQALMLVDEGYDEILTRQGSWAGAVGPAQFMPSAIRRYAVDGDSDGKKDMWSDYDDVLPSVANFLKEKGWRSGQRWGYKVLLPEGFNKGLLTDTLREQHNKTPQEWAALGVHLENGEAMPSDSAMHVMLIAPNFNKQTGEFRGPVYMVYDNFRAVMEYNKSYKYALTVLQMADIIAKQSRSSAAMPAVPPSPAPYNQ
ncbi:MAG: lytic murein transglycosylase [Micavibrio aeruginosavorus]|uniref:Lytic murein transglycosylase n=1 Tax=Micavibrio aeruginosavorus TaxID=349221 RepID=A0A7T5UGJ7_9BACT|nr:MAG: lytic murein transglycosylase [Micavibrio aeruginosavorus]